jgi:hypothetical protein
MYCSTNDANFVNLCLSCHYRLFCSILQFRAVFLMLESSSRRYGVLSVTLPPPSLLSSSIPSMQDDGCLGDIGFGNLSTHGFSVVSLSIRIRGPLPCI